ncbi:MAG: GGDEF domain-containing protein [Rubellimicrobium sp.]|nr:GGDEF domain-containing protein [Rubellimicrobium sp.]
MQWLTDHIAPRSRLAAVLTGALLILLVNLANHLVWLHLRKDTYVPLREVIHATAVSIPFVGVIMATLLHLSRLKERLGVLAETDMLTGLLNRRAFLEQTQPLIEEGRAVALILIDADHFKRINDSLGHAAGDACLLAISDLLRQHAGPQDVLGRMGGEEFALCLEGGPGDEDRLPRIGTSICAGVRICGPDRDEEHSVTLSAGAVICRPGEPIDRLMARADRALYLAKSRGRAQMVLADDDMAPPPGPVALAGPGAFAVAGSEAIGSRRSDMAGNLLADVHGNAMSARILATEDRPSTQGMGRVG